MAKLTFNKGVVEFSKVIEAPIVREFMKQNELGRVSKVHVEIETLDMDNVVLQVLPENGNSTLRAVKYGGVVLELERDIVEKIHALVKDYNSTTGVKFDVYVRDNALVLDASRFPERLVLNRKKFYTVSIYNSKKAKRIKIGNKLIEELAEKNNVSEVKLSVRPVIRGDELILEFELDENGVALPADNTIASYWIVRLLNPRFTIVYSKKAYVEGKKIVAVFDLSLFDVGNLRHTKEFVDEWCAKRGLLLDEKLKFEIASMIMEYVGKILKEEKDYGVTLSSKV